MKKRTKFLLFISMLISFPALINHIIFYCAKRKKRKERKEFFYDWRFGKIRYLVAGHGEPLLLLHDVNTGASLTEWEESIHLLAKHYKVYALDLLGFGYSDKPAISYSSYLYVGLINDFISQVIGKRTNIAASSNSGSLALTAYSFNRSMYNKILLISPSGTANENKIPPDCAIWLKRIIELPILGTFLFNILTSHVALRWFLRTQDFQNAGLVTTQVVEAVYNAAHIGGAGARYSIAAFFGNYLNTDLESALRKTDIPVAVLWGGNNSINPVENFTILEKAKPGLQLTIFEETRKLPHSERPDAFCKLCKSFFG